MRCLSGEASFQIVCEGDKANRCEDEERLRKSPPKVAEVQVYAVEVFKGYFKAKEKEKDKEGFEVVQFRFLLYTMPLFVTALRTTSNETLRTQLVDLLINCTIGSPLRSCLAAPFVMGQSLPAHELHYS